MKLMIKALFTLVAVYIPISAGAEVDDFNVIKTRVVADLTRRSTNDDRVQTTIDRIKADGSFDGIN